MQEHWRERYKSGHTPWDTGKPDINLIRTITERPIQSRKTLEVGCGTGNNALWLAQQGFVVTAIDITDEAIIAGRNKACEVGANIQFAVVDFMTEAIPDLPFGFIFDRGCFHSYRTHDEQRLFAEKVATCLEPEGLWLSLIGSTDGPPREVGPPQHSAKDVVIAVEPSFEILSLISSHFDSLHPQPPRCWVCLMKKRT
ncbi:MAG: class I SAM-dependent methyltransferase [Chloroflexota bacterium]|nr:class I SAM-dependent methyltransferase [Chloroflexota bacterium]